MRLLLTVYVFRSGKFVELCKSPDARKKVVGFLASLAGFCYWWGYKRFELVLRGYCVGAMVEYRDDPLPRLILAIRPFSDCPIVMRYGFGRSDRYCRVGELRPLFVASKNAADYAEAKSYQRKLKNSFKFRVYKFLISSCFPPDI